jgi:hypothetical protein
MSDGKIGLTGYIAFIMSKWNKIYSFDPIVEKEKSYGDRFYIQKKYDYDMNIIKSNNNNDIIILIAVHSHGDLNLFFEKLKDEYMGKKFYVLSMPCCMKKKSLLKLPYNDKFIDLGCISLKNTLYYWKGVF